MDALEVSGYALCMGDEVAMVDLPFSEGIVASMCFDGENSYVIISNGKHGKEGLITQIPMHRKFVIKRSVIKDLKARGQSVGEALPFLVYLKSLGRVYTK